MPSDTWGLLFWNIQKKHVSTKIKEWILYFLWWLFNPDVSLYSTHVQQTEVVVSNILLWQNILIV